MPSKKKRFDGRSNDIECLWFTATYGKKWELWRTYAARWLKQQDKALNAHRNAITWFLERYLIAFDIHSHPDAILLRTSDLPDIFQELCKTISSNEAASRNNKIVWFIDWVILEDYSEPDDHYTPIPQVSNPYKIVSSSVSMTETVRNPLPYRYIKELRSIISPSPRGNFNDWTWANTQTGQQRSNGWRANLLGDWFEVPQKLIDKNDPDCVWRKRVISVGEKISVNGKTQRAKAEIEKYEIWSPVRAMVIYIKLQLPLRTYQVRMLDSGEADHLRYDNGQWHENRTHTFVPDYQPRNRGVFRRIISPEIGEIMTGLYISTNKTADQNKDEIDRGYVIPWQHEDVLYWLEKLRNWQEKYNPIKSPTSAIDLKRKHFGELKSEATRSAMGVFCFLMRDAAAKAMPDKEKPIQDNSLGRLWYQLLQELERRVYSRGETLGNGRAVELVDTYEPGYIEALKVRTNFPLHSLRVSLLTCYALEGSVPAPVLSKLLAGHSRILMTLYYIKITPATMKEMMSCAEKKINASEANSFRRFLSDMEMNDVIASTAFNDSTSIQAALRNKNPVGWEPRHIGLCLVGGNSARSNEAGQVGGCWNGGELIQDKKDPRHRLYGPVPNGPENCCRCRWFITEVQYLNALRAHFNSLSYHAQNAANLAVKHEQTVELLEDERLFANKNHRPFTKLSELYEAERRSEKQKVLANEYANDMNATFRLIARLIAMEKMRDNNDHRQKLVSNGTIDDISTPLNLIETASDLWQLSEICEDAEIYPEEADELLKTPAVVKRAEQLNIALMREDYTPVFMTMDDEMKLIVGNAMMRSMAKKACPKDWRIEGFRIVAGIMEAGLSLQEQGLLKEGVMAIEKKLNAPVIKLGNLIASQTPQEVLTHA